MVGEVVTSPRPLWRSKISSETATSDNAMSEMKKYENLVVCKLFLLVKASVFRGKSERWARKKNRKIAHWNPNRHHSQQQDEWSNKHKDRGYESSIALFRVVNFGSDIFRYCRWELVPPNHYLLCVNWPK